MNEQDYNQLRESSWRRRLTGSEAAGLQEYLTAHPEAREDWLDEAALNQLLAQLPAAPPVASNFTARVLQAAALEAADARRARGRGWPFLRGAWSWLPKAAAAGLVLGFAFAGFHQQQVRARADLANNVAELSAAVSASDTELIRDFEPIRRLSDPEPNADTELLVLMK